MSSSSSPDLAELLRQSALLADLDMGFPPASSGSTPGTFFGVPPSSGGPSLGIHPPLSSSPSPLPQALDGFSSSPSPALQFLGGLRLLVRPRIVLCV